MPRRNRRDPSGPEPLRFDSTTSPMAAPPGWQARGYKGIASDQTYVCPRCHRGVARRSEHVVAWTEDDESRRRHWHTACWQSAVREGIARYRFS